MRIKILFELQKNKDINISELSEITGFSQRKCHKKVKELISRLGYPISYNPATGQITTKDLLAYLPYGYAKIIAPVQQ